MKLMPSLFFILLALNVWAEEKPEAIQLKTKTIRSVEWYAGQATMWADVVQHQSSADAWINYYLASRYAQRSKQDLAMIAQNVSRISPDSFESLVIQGMDEGYTDAAYQYLEKAFRLKPQESITFSALQLLSELRSDLQRRKNFSELLTGTNQISTSLLTYSYNVLMSVEKDAILFTEGENTTVPIFILQDVFKVRQDVKVLNLDMLLNPTYRSAKLSSLALQLENFTATGDDLEDKKTLCSTLPLQNSTGRFYYSLTISKQNITDIKDQLYVVGLASQVSKTRINNIATIKNNLENKFLLDHLTVDFDGEAAEGAGKVLEVNYLVPMLLLAEHYQQNGDTAKADEWQTLIMKLADAHGKSVIVQNILNKQPLGNPFISAGLDVKTLEPSFKHVKDNIYAMKSEVTLQDYNFYISYLEKNNLKDELQRSQIDLSQYQEPALSFMKAYHMWKPTKDQRGTYPIVNISYEAAVAYCEFLTEQYNSDSKRKFKKVKFRLPSINEWQVAALGYKKAQSWKLDEITVVMARPENGEDEICKGCNEQTYAFSTSDIKYPWYYHYNYRNRALNKRGCALGNFKFPENIKPCRPGIPGHDGFILMSFVEAYFPNSMGLYDVVGNVAEMTSEKGKACGGSWNHSPEESTIVSINEYKGPSSEVGFRPFMEVIEQ